ncbi:MAG: DUF6252 family protein [Flavobacteriales bacterium]
MSIAFVGTSVLLGSCKDEEEPEVESPIVCSLPNGTLRWTIDGVERCANASLFGDYGMFLTVNGIAIEGQTLTLELDSLSVGTHELSYDSNFMLYTDGLAVAWEATNEQPGTINITSHNEATNRLEATFQINLVNPINSAVKTITNGQLIINYTE